MKATMPSFKNPTIVTGLAMAISGLWSAVALADTNPQKYPDGTWVTVKGTVVEQEPEHFVLDYGEDTIIVEVDDFDTVPEGRLVFEDDEVTVHGKIDNDFYQKKTIEAESLYIDDLNLSVSSPSAADEEDAYFYYYVHTPIDYDLEVRGEVSSVDGREFTIDYGDQKLTVDTSLMAYNPMDDKGFQQVDEGDHVIVSGELDLDLFEEQELIAENIVTIM